MRTANFRDRVLFPTAFKLGLAIKPSSNMPVGILQDQADAIASYVTDWVRRLWDAEDWPEWTFTQPFDVGGDHIVGYTQFPSSTLPPATIGTVLKVYLVDPSTTRLPVDTHFRLTTDGIYCGLEHGPQVWIKYRIRCPEYTATPWDSSASYATSQLTYSPVSGEVYKSLANGNVGNDPSQTGTLHPLLPETIQEFVPGDPGSPGQSKRIGIDFTRAAPPPAPPDPVLSGSSFDMEVVDVDGVTLATEVVPVVGDTALATVLTTLQTDLVADLPGTFDVQLDNTIFSMILQDNSDFDITVCDWFDPALSVQHDFQLRQIRAYIPPRSPTPVQPKEISVTLSTTDIIPGATYYLNFLDANGTHSVLYVSQPTDGITEIVTGLFNAIATAANVDLFFAQLSTSVSGSTMTFGYAGDFSLNTYCQLAGSSVWWQPNFFPFVLLDQVLRGTYADCMREAGQSDKADSEEAKVPTEEQVRKASILAPQFDPLTDQQKPKSRYQIR